MARLEAAPQGVLYRENEAHRWGEAPAEPEFGARNVSNLTGQRGARDI
jgi:hypothetical protein